MRRTKRKVAIHEPVLVNEVVSALRLKKTAPLKKQVRVIDATLGSGGHAVKAIEAQAFVLGIDADSKMIDISRKVLSQACSVLNRGVEDCFVLAQGNFREIDKIAKDCGFEKVDAILFDLGVSTLQIKSSRGFSFDNPDAPLDMRLDTKAQNVKAADLLNALDKSQLTDLFAGVMSTGSARKLASEVIKQRESKPFKTVSDFLETAKKVKSKKKLHPATLPFLALRIAVNSELENLKEALPKALALLKKKGRLAVISFHSGEDRIVKEFFKESENKILTKKPIVPSDNEINKNPSARSAKLRVLEKI